MRMRVRKQLALVTCCLFATISLAQEPKYVPTSSGSAAADELGEPLVIYDERPHKRLHPSGWMPDGKGIAMDLLYAKRPYSGRVCALVRYDPRQQPEGWVAVAHLVDGKWRKTNRPLNLYAALGAQKGDAIELRWYCRSDTGARVRFEFGGGEGSSAVFSKSKTIDIDGQWQRHSLDVSDLDLTALSGKVFTFILEEVQQPEGKVAYDFVQDRVYLTRVVRKPLDAK